MSDAFPVYLVTTDSWPRISPPGLTLEWTFTYLLPPTIAWNMSSADLMPALRSG